MPVPPLSEPQSAAFAMLSALRSVPDQIGLRLYTTAAQFEAGGIDLDAVRELVALGLACDCVIDAPAWVLTPWGVWAAGEIREAVKQVPDELREDDRRGIEVREHYEYVEVRRPPLHRGEEPEIIHVPTEFPHFEDAQWPHDELVMPVSEHESYVGIPEPLADTMIDKDCGPLWAAIIGEAEEHLAALSPKERRKLVRQMKNEARQEKTLKVEEYDPATGEERQVELKLLGATVMEDKGRAKKAKGGKGRRRAG